MSAISSAEQMRFEPVRAQTSLALRNLGLTLLLALVSVVVAGLLWGTTGYQVLIVAMGWPHIILGFLFYFGKVLRGEWHARSSFLMLALLTLMLWGAHYAYTITGFISIYFTYHVFRDEVFIYFQTRARHRLKRAVHVAGLVPFILLMFIITDPRPQHYRQDLRRVELTGAQVSAEGWTLIPFDPISYSRGKDFYFYVQTPVAEDAGLYTTLATATDTRSDGEIRVSDRQWAQARDILFKPYYMGDERPRREDLAASGQTVMVALTGGHRVGQTFTAERDGLAGVWIPTRSERGQAAEPARFVFHLTPDTSLPLAPLSPGLNAMRLALVALLAVIVLWKALPQLRRMRTFWLYFLLLVAIFGVLQKAIRAGGGAGYEFPVMFQMVVVFHYWSWYVFSFDKLRAGLAQPPTTTVPARQSSLYERMLVNLRSLPRFTALVVALNLISLAGVLWYSRLHGPAALRFVFDYNYFLYFLVFHVTFSFGPRQSPREAKESVPA
ncbi:MAG TPA: hypothetical protein VF544_07545 [Pyrinomonadaceae bacterium]|jgi:hypothetical protein